MKQRLTDEMIVRIRAEYGYSLTKMVKLQDLLEGNDSFILYSVSCIFGYIHLFLYKASSPFAESVIGHWPLEDLLDDPSPLTQAAQGDRTQYLELA